MTREQDVVLEADVVTVLVEGREVLQDVSVQLRRGEVVALVGPNGAGKSTLLAVLSGDRRAESGAVRMNGVDLHAIPVADAARQRSVLLQSNAVSFPFPTEHVVAMGRAPWRRRPEADRDDEAVAVAMDAAEITRFADRPVTALSGGERARVAFARSHAQECAIAMLDEPTAALDIRHQHRLLDTVRSRVVNQDAAAIVVLHDLALAAAYADRIALLAEGRVVAFGTPAEVLEAELLSATYRHPISVLDGPDGRPLVFAHPQYSEVPA